MAQSRRATIIKYLPRNITGRLIYRSKHEISPNCTPRSFWKARVSFYDFSQRVTSKNRKNFDRKCSKLPHDWTLAAESHSAYLQTPEQTKTVHFARKKEALNSDPSLTWESSSNSSPLFSMTEICHRFPPFLVVSLPLAFAIHRFTFSAWIEPGKKART